jgi:hypothetical protein
MVGFEPTPQGLEGPRAIRYPTFAIWFGLRVSNPSLHDGAVGCLPPHPGRTVTGYSPAFRHPSVFKDPARFERGGQQGIADHPHAPPPFIWRQRQDSNPDPRVLESRMLPVTPRCRSQLRIHNSQPFLDAVLPSDLARAFWPARPKNKKGLLGDRPRRPVYSMKTGPLGRVTSLIQRADVLAKAWLLRGSEQTDGRSPRVFPIHGSSRCRGARRIGYA